MMSRKRRDIRGKREVVAVGLTGGIGAGKSTALSLFAGLGAQVISADELVHDLYEQPDLVAEVGAHFGPGVVSSDGVVDRARLAEAVRGRPDELRFLEELTHSRVSREIVRRVMAAGPGSVIVCEVPLLFESGFEGLFDLVVTIEADRLVRRRRSVQSFDLGQFTELESLQTSREQRTKGSDLSYVNDGGLAELAEFVEEAYGEARTLLGDSRSRSMNER
jgi:dephospho-CoA kinase